MGANKQVLHVIDEVLSLAGHSTSFDAQTRLLGAIAERDSMAVVTLTAALETAQIETAQLAPRPQGRT
jgi:Tfp pilus assembly protein PilN